MSAQSTTDLPEDQRRAVFAALVSAQDEGFSVPYSREVTARRYALTVEQVRDIEEQGVNGKWPPL